MQEARRQGLGQVAQEPLALLPAAEVAPRPCPRYARVHYRDVRIDSATCNVAHCIECKGRATELPALAQHEKVDKECGC